jgi:hypothetical protein
MSTRVRTDKPYQDNGYTEIVGVADIAAFGGFAAAVPELRHLMDGVELAHSLTLDGESRLLIASCLC